jgi:hypothetical protein
MRVLLDVLWTRLLDMADEIRAFIEDHRDRLKWKDKDGDA